MLPWIQSRFTIIASTPIHLGSFTISYKERKKVKEGDSSQDFSDTRCQIKKKIEAKDTTTMSYQTTCLLVVGSPIFWNAPNST